MEIKFSNGEVYTTDEEEVALHVACRATNAPVMFGCRVGLCGLCKVEVSNPESFSKKNEAEHEFTEKETERLACQCYVKGDTSVKQS